MSSHCLLPLQEAPLVHCSCGEPGRVNRDGSVLKGHLTHSSLDLPPLGRLANVGLMLGHRRRRWPNIKPTLFKRLVLPPMGPRVRLGPSNASLFNYLICPCLEHWSNVGLTWVSIWNHLLICLWPAALTCVLKKHLFCSRTPIFKCYTWVLAFIWLW